ncbi:hypothetical protein Tco_1010443 [Tanacetum coccineum]
MNYQCSRAVDQQVAAAGDAAWRCLLRVDDHGLENGNNLLHTLSRPAIDENSKGLAGNPAPGIVGIACVVLDEVSEVVDLVEVFFTAGSAVSFGTFQLFIHGSMDPLRLKPLCLVIDCSKFCTAVKVMILAGFDPIAVVCVVMDEDVPWLDCRNLRNLSRGRT